jgi:hypothetical protein
MPDSSALSETAPAATPFVAFEFRDFRLFQASALVSTIGLQMQSVAVGWQVYALTGKALDFRRFALRHGWRGWRLCVRDIARADHS